MSRRASRAATRCATALEEEGFDEHDRRRVGRKLRAAFSWWRIDAWQESGFQAVARRLSAAARRASKGLRRDIDEQRRSLRASRRQGEAERKTARAGARCAVMARSAHARGRDMKLLRTIRLDPSDTFVFERAAEPGEWAVSGAFAFWHSDPDATGGQGALGLPRRLSRRRIARLVDAGADRRGERRRRAPRWSKRWRNN